MSSPWVRVQVGEQMSKAEDGAAVKAAAPAVAPARLLEQRKVPKTKKRVDSEETLVARMVALERRAPARPRQATPQPVFRASGKTIRDSLGPLVVHQFGLIVPKEEGVSIG